MFIWSICNPGKAEPDNSYTITPSELRLMSTLSSNASKAANSGNRQANNSHFTLRTLQRVGPYDHSNDNNNSRYFNTLLGETDTSTLQTNTAVSSWSFQTKSLLEGNSPQTNRDSSYHSTLNKPAEVSVDRSSVVDLQEEVIIKSKRNSVVRRASSLRYFTTSIQDDDSQQCILNEGSINSSCSNQSYNNPALHF